MKMLYNLSDQQVQQLKALIANAQIRGEDAPIIMGLIGALSMPIKEKPDVKGKEEPIHKGKAGSD